MTPAPAPEEARVVLDRVRMAFGSREVFRSLSCRFPPGKISVILVGDAPSSGREPLAVRRIEALLVRLNEQLGSTMIIVSHHIASTMRMANHIVLLLPDGPVEGRPQELRRSSVPAVRAFLDEDADDVAAAATGLD